MAKAGTVEEYVDALPDAARGLVVDLLRVAREVLPDAEERLSYGIPALAVGGRTVVHVAGWAKHVSVYPVPDDPALAADLAPYVAGKGTLRFDLDQPVPYDLVRRLVAALAERVDRQRPDPPKG